MDFRIGHGYDVHAMRRNEKFVLGGVEIDHHSGAFGHSDADVLLHAICDALLGALALGDIGTHFPDSDPDYKGIDSRKLLEKSVSLVHKEGYRISNLDCTICLQSPKLKPYIPEMRNQVAGILSVDQGDVSIKATTTEKLGFVGREEGVSAHTVVLLMRE